MREILATIELVAHRGNAAEFPENTLPAFESAARLGCRWLECDVQLAADGIPFVAHDVDLQRTAGVTMNILQTVSRDLDAVEPVEAARFGARFNGIPLPRLTALAAWLASWPGPGLFVELKRASLLHHGRHACLDAADGSLTTVRDRCVIISFDLEVLPLARRRGYRIGWVLPRYDDAALAALDVLQPDFVFCDHYRLPVDGPLPAGTWEWACYEVQSATLARQLHGRGVRFIETMEVARLTRELGAGAAST